MEFFVMTCFPVTCQNFVGISRYFKRLGDPLLSCYPFPHLQPPVSLPIAWGRGEVDRQLEGWKITAGWGGVRLAASSGGGRTLGEEGWIWPPGPEGVEDYCWVGRGEFDSQKGRDDCRVGRGEFNSQKGWRMTAGWVGVNLTAKRSGGWPLGGEWGG